MERALNPGLQLYVLMLQLQSDPGHIPRKLNFEPGLEPGPPALRANALTTELSRTSTGIGTGCTYITSTFFLD